MKHPSPPICDLHTHSTCSDGSFSPEELIAEAAREGVSAVALTDHNTIAGLARFEAAAQKSDIMAVPGVEITAGVTVGEGREKEVHILGLLIPPEVRDALADFLAEIDRRKRQSNLALIERLSAAGYDIDHASVLSVAGEATPNRVHVANVLMARGYVASVREAFDTLIRDGGDFYRAPERLNALEVMDFLGALGVVSVLAHPLLTLSREEICALLPVARARGLCGVETIYPLYSADDAAFMAEVAEANQLLPSGGSDFHGANKPDTRMGVGKENILVPYAFFENLQTYAQQSVRPPLTGTVHPLGSFPTYKYVVVCTLLDGNVVLSRHKNRQTWETQGGHIEPHETPLDAARRELYEESGIRDAELIPLCDYCGYRGKRFAYGVFFLAKASSLDPLPASEMAEVRLFDTLPPPAKLTYPLMTPFLFEEAQKLTK